MNTINKTLMDKNCDDIIDKSPDERYFKFNKLIGSGAFKKIFLSFDTMNGIEVAWNEINISNLLDSSIQKIINEIEILKSCNNCSYIIKFYDYWNNNSNNIIFITEKASSGNLKEFITKIKNIKNSKTTDENLKLKIIKKWCKQILYGLDYLHDNDIIHRDIKCDNIFINGNTGNILIGDFGLARKMMDSKAHTVLGTPAFMAPEIYDEEYGKKVDIYSFGMCLLEMITNEVPYIECQTNPAIWKKVINNIKPKSLDKIKNKEIKNIIELCISNDENIRPTIKILLKMKFWDNDCYNKDILYDEIVENNELNEKLDQILSTVEKKTQEIINNAKEQVKEIIQGRI